MWLQRRFGDALPLLIAALVGCGVDPGATPPTHAARSEVVIEGASAHVTVDLGDRHGCVIRSDGKVYCWGANNAGQTDPSVSSGPPVTSLLYAAPVALPGGAKAAEVAVGEDFSCARLQSGSVVCWGSNNQGINPGGATGFMAPTVIPVTVPSDGAAVRSAKAIAAGHRHLCILRDNGSVVCHGSNANFRLGRLASSPADVVRSNNGLPLGTLPTFTTAALGDVVKIAAAGSHTCALDAGGQVYCWGLWDGLSESLAMPVFGANPGMIDLVAGGDINSSGIANGDHSCSLRVDHTVYCWGDNVYGQLGDNTVTRRQTPVYVRLPDNSLLNNVVALAAGDHHTCATTLGDRTFCWGSNGSGQLSRATFAPTTWTPNLAEPVGGTSTPLTGVQTLVAGDGFTCATALNSTTYNDGAVKCWGRNDEGQLGNGSTSGSSTPVTTYTPDNVCTYYLPNPVYYNVWTSPHGGPILDSGHEHTCAFVEQSVCSGTGGTYRRGVLCWGLNNLQQVGANIAATSLAPTFVPLAANVIQLSAGGHHACAVDTVGRVWCWGANNLGQCGTTGSTVNTPTLVAMGNLPPAVQVTAGADFTCALLSDGTVACWGSNQFGALGREPYNTSWHGPGFTPPAPVVGFGAGAFNATPARVRCGLGCVGCEQLNSVKQVSAGTNSVCALLADGTVRCWGENPRANPSDSTTRILGCTGDPRFCHPTWTSPYSGGQNVLPHAGPPGANFGITFTSASVSMHDKGGCVVRPGGIAQCWGEQNSGRAGNNSFGGLTHLIQNVVFTPPAGGALVTMPDVVSVNGGWATKCAVRTNGEVRCWGLNTSGQAGVNPTLASAVADARLVTTSGGAPFAGAIAATTGQSHACAMTAANAISCWGSNANTHLGSGGGDTFTTRAILLPP